MTQTRTASQVTSHIAQACTSPSSSGNSTLTGHTTAPLVTAGLPTSWESMLAEPHDGPARPPENFCRVIDHLMSPGDATNEGQDRRNALRQLNEVLAKEGFEVFRGEDQHCYLRHVGTKTITTLAANPHGPLTPAEVERRNELAAYLDKCSEDELIEEVLLPLFRQLGFHRITAAGHKDKALEYGKDIWMRFTLPTQHILYFGIQAKRGKIDASGVTKSGNANVAEIHHQALMMLAHEIFDPETNKRVLVDHAFIVAGGEITKAARNWAIVRMLDDQAMRLGRDLGVDEPNEVVSAGRGCWVRKAEGLGCDGVVVQLKDAATAHREPDHVGRPESNRPVAWSPPAQWPAPHRRSAARR